MPLDDLTFSDVSEADMAAVRAIAATSFGENGDDGALHAAGVPDDIEHRIVTAAGRDGTIVAYALLQTPGIATRVQSLAVHPDHRRRGYGTALLAHVIAQTRAPLEVLVDPANAPAIHLYERLGFTVVANKTSDPRKRAMVRRPVAAPPG